MTISSASNSASNAVHAVQLGLRRVLGDLPADAALAAHLSAVEAVDRARIGAARLVAAAEQRDRFPAIVRRRRSARSRSSPAAAPRSGSRDCRPAGRPRAAWRRRARSRTRTRWPDGAAARRQASRARRCRGWREVRRPGRRRPGLRPGRRDRRAYRRARPRCRRRRARSATPALPAPAPGSSTRQEVQRRRCRWQAAARPPPHARRWGLGRSADEHASSGSSNSPHLARRGGTLNQVTSTSAAKPV